MIFVRKLLKKSWMDKQRAAELGGLQADALRNFSTQQNSLSLFSVDEDVPAERVVCVIALGREFIDNVDFAVFDGGGLQALGLNIRQSPGETADSRVNENHYDVFDLTADKLVALADFIHLKGEVLRITKTSVKKKLADRVDCPDLDWTRVNPKIAAELR